jgi:hypothetical protein
MKKLIKEDKNKFYLYNPIPIVKQEASEVIQRILRTHGLSFEFGKDVDLNQLDTVNKMRMKDYINRIVKYKEIRGHAIEGLMCGLYQGNLNNSQSGSWDYSVAPGTVEQKYVEDEGESPVIGGYKQVLTSLGPEVNAIVKNVTEKYGESNIFLINDDELTEIKKNVLAGMTADIVCISTKIIDRIRSYYFTKENFINIFSDASNCSAPKQKGGNQIRIKSSAVRSQGITFDIIVPKISEKEYDDFLNINQEEQAVAQIFGPFSNKIRPDILKWIKNNKEQFKDLVNSL